MLEIQNLCVEIENKKIINNLSMKLELGNVYALMGKNGSGKSTLANVLLGNPKYKITSGKILLNNEDITDLSPDKRAQLGMFMSFQMPQEVEGVTIFDFLRTSYNSLNKKISLLDFKKLLDEKCRLLGLDESFSERYLNKGFSGGEKKKCEILQLLVLNPSIIILDETDSGLDIDALRTISKAISLLKDSNKIILIISHYKRIFNEIHADKVFIMQEGNIIHEGNKELIDEIEKDGYEVLKSREK